MTVQAETNKVTYSCDGSTTTFDFTFKVFKTSDIKVILVTVATGDEEVLTETTDYAVTGSLTSGGKVTTVSTYSSDYKLLIVLDMTVEQQTDLIYGGTYSSEAIEEMSDKLTKIAQQHDEELSRTIKFQVHSSESEVEIEDLTADKAVVVNAAGDGLKMGPSADEISNAQTYAEVAETAQAAAELAETNAETAAAAAQAAKTAAELAETHAETAETNAVTAKNAAETAQTAAELAETGAQTAQGAAETAETNAETAQTAAELAETHAAASESAASTSETNAANSESAAATSETNAAASEAKTEKWAEENEDVEVETGKYSAKHYAAKSEESADAAAVSASIIPSPVASKEGALILQNAADDGYDLLETQGSAGQVLTSAGANAKPSFQSSTTSYVKTMTGDETPAYVQGYSSINHLDPGGANRTFNPTASFPAGYEMVVINTGEETIVFDSGGLGQGIGAGQKISFCFDGTNWY